ncbi:MAG: RNA polymerase sigma-70 factor [Prolixibacteraceae bacterium]|jgi:RNA polymerase sigma-70 factor (ECF subfamily)|nr:RNA polymerase sigma-70 factor [Prolixibacteraceae bacterium]
MEAGPFHLDTYFLQHFQEGNESSFEEVFKTYYNRIVGFCQQFIGDKDQAQGVAQEAFVKLWLNRQKVETVNGIHSFLYTAAKTDSLNYLRHQKVIGKYRDKQLHLKEEELNREILESFDFDQLEFMELEKMIIRSINELPEKCRMVFELSRIEGKKNCEIAAQLNITVKSVEANMTRALKTLRVKLAEYLPLILVQLIMKNF